MNSQLTINMSSDSEVQNVLQVEFPGYGGICGFNCSPITLILNTVQKSWFSLITFCANRFIRVIRFISVQFFIQLESKVLI